MLHLNWKSHFAARVDNNLHNKNTLVYTEAWFPDKNNDEQLQTLILDINNVLLATDQDMKIHTLHSSKVLGGTLLRPAPKLLCLWGSGPSAGTFIINKQSLLNPCNLITPTINELQECSNKDQVNTVISPPNNGAVTYPGSASFFAAPWLVDVITATAISNNSKLIPALNTAAAAFDTKHKNDAEYIMKAQDHAGNFILWAWGAGAGQVSATKMTFDLNDGNLEHFKNKRHQHCITQAWINPPGGLPPPHAAVNQAGVLNLLNATIARQVDEKEVQNTILTKHLEHMVEKDGSSKNRVKSLHKSTTKMLLFCVSHGQEKPSQPTSCTLANNS
jgi:hypothetical protein